MKYYKLITEITQKNLYFVKVFCIIELQQLQKGVFKWKTK
nr:MAG TPA: hypothetical protein [Caudoviricetes sp.]